MVSFFNNNNNNNRRNYYCMSSFRIVSLLLFVLLLFNVTTNHKLTTVQSFQIQHQQQPSQSSLQVKHGDVGCSSSIVLGNYGRVGGVGWGSSTCTSQRQINHNKQMISRTTKTRSSTTTSLNMFMGSDGGLLGVGGPEVVLILLVGYFVLGPSDLYKLVKEIGKFIQNIRTLGSDLTTTFENNMNDVVQLEELRKAQRELNDAFSFRRSINVEPESEAFSVQPAYNSVTSATWDSNNNSYESGTTTAVTTMAATATATPTATTTATATTTTSSNPRKVRRRILKKAPAVPQQESSFPTVTDYGMPNMVVGDIPTELDMSSYYNNNNEYNNEIDNISTSASASSSTTMSAEEIDIIEREFDQYTSTTSKESKLSTSSSKNTMDKELETSTPWFNTEKDTVTTTTPPKDGVTALPIEQRIQQQSRFQQQLSGNWNTQVIANEEKLEPIALVMNQIALLEKQKKDAMERITEEYEQKKKMETKFYLQQRQLLEQAVTNVQNDAFGV